MALSKSVEISAPRSGSRARAPRSSSGVATTPRSSELDDAPVETCMEYLSRPHTSWISATKELARIEARKQEDDARSCSSTVSAYSVKSSASAMSTASSSSSLRRGHMSKLPQRGRTSSEPPPPVDLAIGGSSIGGFSFLAPRSSSSSCGTVAGVSAAAGTPAGRCGAVRVSGPVAHPQSAPAAQPHGARIPVKPGAIVTPVTPSDSYQFNGFVPRMAPKKR